VPSSSPAPPRDGFPRGAPSSDLIQPRSRIRNLARTNPAPHRRRTTRFSAPQGEPPRPTPRILAGSTGRSVSRWRRLRHRPRFARPSSRKP
jgi:hypothetical protein